ncbi:MAG: hypothetical protein J6Y26_00135, partial [Lachnospiraceae bacterium]|nr:hypothetical protein [Lachnospiraceae bacterium]
AKEGEAYYDDQIAGLTARREYLQGKRQSIPSEVSPYQQWETENPGDKAWQKEFDLLLKLQSGEITEAEYDAGVKAIKETHPENVLDRTLKEYRDAGSEIERLDAQEKILQDYKKYYGIMQMDQTVQDLFAERYDAENSKDNTFLLAVAEAWANRDNPSGYNKRLMDDDAKSASNTYLVTAPERIRKANEELRKAGLTDEQIEELYSAYAGVKNDERAEDVKKEYAAYASEHPIVSSVASVVLGVESGTMGLLGLVFHPGQRNTSFTDAQTISSAIRETVNNKIETTVKEKTGSKFLATIATWGYDALTSSVESAIAMSVGGVGEVFLGLNAAMEQYNEALNNGWDTGRAVTSAVFTGAFESVFEHLSLENLRALKTQGRKGAVNRLKDLIKSFITEGSEELFTDVANEAYDYFFNGGLSAYETFASDYREQNPTASDSEIAGQYAKKFGEQITQSFIVGGFSGVMGAGRTQALQSIGAVSEKVETGRGLRELSALTGRSERSLVSPIEEALPTGSKAQQRIEARLSNETPQGSQSSEVRA